MNKLNFYKKLVVSIFVFTCFFGVNSIAQNQFSKALILDMVHHNPGEEPYKSAYNNPAVIKEMGYNGKVYFLFESPALAINWESVDPDILPKGSKEREWVDDKASQIKKMQASCVEQGMSIYAMSDLVLFPKRLIEMYGIEKTFGDPNDPKTEKFIRAQINEMFDQFPSLDGLVVRIGETYLHDAPYHQGAIDNKTSPENTIIPLMQILREEICVKRDKQLIFRTWNSFDRDRVAYMKVNDAVEPHQNLIISIKQCEGDFHRARPFSKLIGQGRHPQIIEVQCAREYEGKGAYPNYIANGVIEGFEEHARMPEEQINSLHEFVEKRPDIYAGIWTWSRGGGWDGPYIKNEMWCDLNAWVMAQWAKDPRQHEEPIFNRYASERLHLKGADIAKFRKLCLLSAEAVVRGRNTTYNDISDVWWTRDQGIGWPASAKDSIAQKRNLEQKDESVAKWEEIVKLAKKIHWENEKTRDYAVGSAEYGYRLYKIYRILVNMSDAEAKGDMKRVEKWIKAYDKAWIAYKKLPEKYNSMSTLYTQEYNRHIKNNADQKVNKLRSCN
ncbi:hypothetical protein ACT3CE_05065 [Marinifilum sp. RC60d5]|uniref:hypothetical protein n=1 Tax=Marinifilum sp. RC60d5 TaxID=3458414 RepID=UPI004036D8BD